MKRIAALVLTVLFVLLAATSAFAQDPAAVNPKTIRVRVDNERVRVLEAVLEPGDKEQMHSHPPYVIYVVSGGKAVSHSPDGKSSEMELVTGATLYRDAVTHWAENVGTTTIHLILVELKSSRGSAAPAR